MWVGGSLGSWASKRYTAVAIRHRTCVSNGSVAYNPGTSHSIESLSFCKRNMGSLRPTSARSAQHFEEGNAAGGLMQRVNLSRKDEETQPCFDIIEETVVHQRYLTVYNRRVRFPSGGLLNSEVARKEVEYDVVGHPSANFKYCVVFPYHLDADKRDWQKGHVTVIKEYCQGLNDVLYSLPAGAFDPRKHGTDVDCARAELNEEAHLLGGELYHLLGTGVEVAEVKWCRNKFIPFIAIDPVLDDCPSDRDAEEWIQIERMDIDRLKNIVKSGDMLLPSVSTCFWAMEWLDEHYKSIVDAGRKAQ